MALRGGLKMSSEDMSCVNHLLETSDLLRPPICGLQEPSNRVAISLLLRKIIAGAFRVNLSDNPYSALRWPVVVSLCRDLADQKITDITNVTSLYETFLRMLRDLDDETLVYTKPLLDGADILVILETLNYCSGRHTTKLFNLALVWQLEHAVGTKEQCGRWLREQWIKDGTSIA